VARFFGNDPSPLVGRCASKTTLEGLIEKDGNEEAKAGSLGEGSSQTTKALSLGAQRLGRQAMFRAAPPASVTAPNSGEDGSSASGLFRKSLKQGIAEASPQRSIW
jgi:hypothetical protein